MSGLLPCTAKRGVCRGEKRLKVGERTRICGPIRHEWKCDEIVEGIVRVTITGDVLFDNARHPNQKFVMLTFKPFEYLGRDTVVVDYIYYEGPWPSLMAKSNFRKFLGNYLQTILEVEKYLTEVQREGIKKYLQEKLAEISDGSVMWEQLKQVPNKINITDPADILMMRKILAVCGIAPACDSELVFENA